jgi:hypothetical protein
MLALDLVLICTYFWFLNWSKFKTVTKSTKVAQKAHSEDKNEEVAKPELESKEKPMRIIDMTSFDPTKLVYMPFCDHFYPLFGGVDEASFPRRLNEICVAS